MAPGGLREHDFTGGLWLLAADGRINWLSFDLDKPVHWQYVPDFGRRIYSGPLVVSLWAFVD
mgnify:CR=1 FL=1